MSKYDLRPGKDDKWEVFDVVTGEIVTLGGMLLSGLDLETAKGALDALLHKIVGPNGSTGGASDKDGEAP